MREPEFLRKNKATWQEYERLLRTDGAVDNPDRLAELYTRLTDDLAYARTFYPSSQTTRYLNELAAQTHFSIYRHNPRDKSRLLSFWTDELPLILHRNRRFLLYATLFFTFFFLVGLVSALMDYSYIQKTIPNGAAYVKMTEENIARGNPTAVYQQGGSFESFVGIAFNNLKVTVLTYVFGLLASVGTLWVLFGNGVMLGGFLALFVRGDQSWWDSLLIIYIHGTIEISMIVVAGAAGLMLGNSLLFPGTYTRAQSLGRASRESVKVLVGLMPFVVLAAFLEGYVTRYADMPLVLNILIILLSLALVLGYFVWWPARRARSVLPLSSPFNNSIP